LTISVTTGYDWTDTVPYAEIQRHQPGDGSGYGRLRDPQHFRDLGLDATAADVRQGNDQRPVEPEARRPGVPGDGFAVPMHEYGQLGDVVPVQPVV